MIKGNKGEWSEFYAFLKILTDGKMFTADKDLEILRDNFYIVLKIIREETNGKKSYDISKGDGKIVIKDDVVSGLNDVVEIEKIKNRVVDIFEKMKNSRNTTFEISLAEKTMKDLHCSQIKASSGRKADLMIVLHDKKSPAFPELGFSIKSMLGSPSTLLNASGATNFIYSVIDYSDVNEDSASCNGALTVRDKASHIYGSGGCLKYCGMDSEGFRKNLRKIDSKFPEIIAEIIKSYYNGKGSKISDLVNYISEDTEFCAKLDFNKSDFVFKVKRFLSDVALGMTPKKEWDGYAKAHGGYIIVKENGEIVCYHIYNRDEFEEYLYNNTKLDTPSTTRHKFGYVYKENEEKKIKYNLQIRFIK
ncbi:MAG TPA: HpaII family restriction endonuclease [Candidatus Moranbacteria bacterium]|nr:MAG: Type II restriction endonuclease HpaII [Candidatus Moranbacteria bacterium GW2011_GWF1_34_10]HBI17692.1 HpaII family restriction endonuclease [Candidatus Moranbacteria bacterium]